MPGTAGAVSTARGVGRLAPGLETDMFKTTTALAGLAMSAALLCTSAAQAEFTRDNGGIGPLTLKKVAGCLVTGASADFTDDVLLINKGGSILKAGDKIEWKVSGYGQGTHTLVADLSPNGTKHLLNALPSAAPAGETCNAKVK
jgi:hypothetical protein